jgi:hypothetical protein
MFLDLPDRKFGQVLVDFSDDPSFHVDMKSAAQFRQRARWRNDYDRLDLFSAPHVLQRGSHVLCETFLCQFVPIGRVHTAAQVVAARLRTRPGRSVPCSCVGKFASEAPSGSA